MAAKTDAVLLRTGVNKRTVLFATTLATVLAPLVGSTANVAIPSIGVEFSMDAVLLSWLATGYYLVSAMLLVPFGRVADIYGRKKIFVYGVSVNTASAVLCGLSTSPAMLIPFRITQGIGSAMMIGTSVAILTSVFPSRERGRVLGLNTAASYVGLSLGPFVGGLLTQHLGWRSVFLVYFPVGIVLIVAVLWGLRGEWAEARGEGFDMIGAIAYGIPLAAVMFGLSQVPTALGGVLILAGVLGFVVFIAWEGRSKAPMLDIDLFRHNAVFAFSNLAALINYSATAAVGFLLSLYLQYLKGLGPQDTGLILVSQPVVMAVVSPIAGRVSDKVQPRVLASIGMGFTVVSLFLFSLIDDQTTQWYIVATLVVGGIGFAIFSSPNTVAVMGSVDRKHYSTASATVGTMRVTGQMLSMGIAMLVFALTMGAVEITPEYYPLFLTSVKLIFLIYAVFCIVGVFASLARGDVRRDDSFPEMPKVID